MVKTVITDYEKLSERAEEVLNLKKDNSLVRETIIDLKQTIQKNNYVCLTAPQIGINKRILCINFNGDIRTLIDPIITNSKEWMLSREKCPSIGETEYIVPRNSKVTLMYTTPLGKYETREFIGRAACAAQYGINLLDGVLLSDFGLELDKHWDNDLTQDEKDEILNMYLESLDLKGKLLNKEIESNPETKQIADAIKFMDSIAKGETQVEQVSKE